MATRKSNSMKALESIAGVSLTLGEFLKSIRLGERESQTAFAEKLGVTRSHLCDIEKGRKTVGAARAAKWATLLGYSEAQFVRLALQGLVREAGLSLKVSVESA